MQRGLRKAIRRVLLLKKTSRLDYERRRYAQYNEESFKAKLLSIGSDYDGLLLRHEQHEDSVNEVHQSLLSRGVEVLLRQRETITKDDVSSSDVLISAGGDGNFLAAASRVLRPDKLVIGINTDPEKSEGHLCITPTAEHSISSIIDYIMENRLNLIHRQRIHVSINGEGLPVLALNEAFIGDTDPSQVSYFELISDGGEWLKTRNSGMLVYTGTGSTSWAYNINKLSTVAVSRLLEIAKSSGAVSFNEDLDTTVEKIMALYNSSNVLSGSEDGFMSYIIREQIERGITNPTISQSGTCSKLKVRSRSWNNKIIVDGQRLYEFPNGSEATFTLGDQYKLLTASLPI